MSPVCAHRDARLSCVSAGLVWLVCITLVLALAHQWFDTPVWIIFPVGVLVGLLVRRVYDWTRSVERW